MSVPRHKPVRRNTGAASRQGAQQLRTFIDNAESMAWIKDLDGRFLMVNRRMEQCLGRPQKELLGRTVFDVHSPELAEAYTRDDRAVVAAGCSMEFEEVVDLPGGLRLFSVVKFPLRNSAGTIYALGALCTDITESRRIERERDATAEFLQLVTESADTRDLIRKAVAFFQKESGFHAVGVRLKNGADFPYYEVRGFDQEFLVTENSLCNRDAAGNVRRDDAGDPVLACMCGNIIAGRFDPRQPFFSAHGSFWTNSTTALLAGTTPADRLADTRNRCNGDGYESVALIPLHVGDQRLGLLQMNDRRRGRISPELLALWERLAGHLAVALAKFRAEEALRESETRYRLIAENTADVIWMLNLATGRFSYVSPSVTRLTGFAPEEITGAAIKDVLDPESCRIAEANLRERIAELKAGDERRRTMTHELREVCKDGSTVPIEVVSSLLSDAAGNATHVLGTTRDIRERKRNEDALRAKDELLRLTGEMAKVGGWEFDPETGKGTWTDEVARIHDLDPSLPTSRELGITFFTPESQTRIRQAIRNAVETAAPYDLELNLVSAKGVAKWVRTAGWPVVQDGRVVKIRGIMKDITLRREAMEEVRRLNQTLEQRVADRTAQLAAANQELEAFAYSVSHDLRAPLRAINGFARILEEEHAGKLDAEGLRVLAVVRNETIRMGQLIDDLLAFSRTSRKPLCAEPVDMTALARAVFGECAAAVPERAVRLQMGELAPAHGDAALLRQVFANLIGNAVKYTRTRGVAEIEIGSRAGDGGTVYHVRDNGVGFDMRYAGKLFGIFQRLHPEDAFEGTGVGLALVKRIIHRHGGRVWAEGAPDAGATFFFTLPGPCGSDAPESTP